MKKKELEAKDIKINQNNKMVCLNTEKLIYLEAKVNYTYLHTADKKYISAKTLKEYEGRLSEQKFIRIHKSHMVNMDFVEKLTKEDNKPVLLLKTGEKLDVSRRRIKQFKEVISKKN